jgi:outer membrane receptor protein involved in Fe transport
VGKSYDYSKINSIKLKDYFRMDLRVYWKRNKPNFTRTWSLDIQNLANTQNEAYSYYDFRATKIVQQFQLGLIPVLNYKVEF